MAEADAAIPDEDVAADTGPARRGMSKSQRRLLMFGVPLLIVAGVLYYWHSLQGKVSTDNAYLKQDKVSVSAQVGGRIVEVAVKEGALVKTGDLLFRIDPEPYRLEIAQANAAIAAAQANVTALSNVADLSGADIAAAREDIAFAQSRFARQKALWDRGFTTKADYDAARHAIEQARADLRIAEAAKREANARLATGAAVPGENPQIAAAKAQRATAELNLRRTIVRAPGPGRVAEADRLQVGQQIIADLPVLTLVATNSSFVEANFKETDLDHMRIGQPAEIRFDAYPEMALKGHVASIGAGTGSEFSVIPAQNATGNWVKVTQRVPVRIHIDEKSPRQLLTGLSTEVTVFTDRSKR